MPKLDLVGAQRIKVAGGEALAIKGAGFSWAKPMTLSDYYGIGPGQIPTHLPVYDPAYVTVDGSNYVTGVQNIGGAGAAFDVVGGGGASTYVGGGMLFGGTNFNTFASTLSINDVHLLFAAKLESGQDGGPVASVPFGFIASIYPVTNGTKFDLRESYGGGNTLFASVTAYSGPDNFGWHIYESRRNGTTGVMEYFCDGVLKGTATSEPGVNFQISRLGQGSIGGTKFLTGSVGGIFGCITDPAHSATNLEPAVLLARQTLAAQYGVTLA